MIDLRCALDDTAIVVRSPNQQNLGKILQCERLMGFGGLLYWNHIGLKFVEGEAYSKLYGGTPRWLWCVDGVVVWYCEGYGLTIELPYIYDDFLCPLRSHPGVDETLIWLPKKARQK